MRCILLAGLLLSGLAGLAQAAKKRKPVSVPAAAASNLHTVSSTTLLANGFAGDTTYLSSSDFSGAGTVSDPIRTKTSAFQTWLESLPGYSNGGNKYLASDFTWKTVTSNNNSPKTLDAPSLAATTLSSSAISLSWSDVNHESGYLLQRSQDNASWTNVAQPGTDATQFTNAGLAASTLYYYRIKALGDGANYVDGPFASASATTQSAGGGGGTGNSPDALLFNVAYAINVQQHPDGPGTYHSTQQNGIAQGVKKLPAGTDGLVYFKYTAGSGEWLSLGYTPNNALQGYEKWWGGLLLFNTQARVKSYGWNASTEDLGLNAVNNHFYGFRRAGNAIEIVTSTDETNWTVLGYGNYTSDDLYVQVYFQNESKIKVFSKNLVTY